MEREYGGVVVARGGQRGVVGEVDSVCGVHLDANCWGVAGEVGERGEVGRGFGGRDVDEGFGNCCDCWDGWGEEGGEEEEKVHHD